MSKRVILPNKYVGENNAVLFDFTSSLVQNDSLAGTPTVTAAVYSGTDAVPSSLIVGSTFRLGNVARQQLTGGVAGVTYILTCTGVSALGFTMQLHGFMTVLPSAP